MTDIEKQLLAAENVANREPEDGPEYDRWSLYRQLKAGEDRVTREREPDEPSADEMDRCDERNANRFNGRCE